MAQQTLRLKAIQAVSPTLVENLRKCKLSAGLSRVARIRQHVLGNPKAWLGTAYHAVLGAVGYGQEGDFDARVRDLWESATEQEYERARTHPLDKRFGPPEWWPGYHMFAAMAVVRAREMVEETNRRISSNGKGCPDRASWREKKFSGAGGRIVGRPDLVRSGEVVDFKTGDVFEDERQEVKAAHVRQLRLYAYLVKETLGWWPRRGVLLRMAGPPVAVELDAGGCEAEAEQALHLMKEYNEALASSSDPIDLASPSPANCRWCMYQLFCPAFWIAVVPDWRDDLGSAAVAGSAMSPAVRIHDGSALSISLQVERGVRGPGENISLFPLDPSVHADVPSIKEGDQLRVTGLWRRSDDTIVATRQTVMALGETLPRIELET